MLIKGYFLIFNKLKKKQLKATFFFSYYYPFYSPRKNYKNLHNIQISRKTQLYSAHYSNRLYHTAKIDNYASEQNYLFCFGNVNKLRLNRVWIRYASFKVYYNIIIITLLYICIYINVRLRSWSLP